MRSSSTLLYPPPPSHTYYGPPVPPYNKRLDDLGHVASSHTAAFVTVLVAGVSLAVLTAWTLRVICCLPNASEKWKKGCTGSWLGMLFIWAMVSSGWNTYASLIGEKGLAEFMAIMDAITALATLSLTISQVYTAWKANKSALAALLATGLNLFVLVFRIIFAACQCRELHFYAANLGALAGNLGAFAPVYVEMMESLYKTQAN